MNFKKIGIVIADNDEYYPFEKLVSSFNAEKYDGFGREGVTFFSGGVRIVALFSYVGKVNAAAAAMHLADIGCDLILNFGLSGGISGVRRGDYTLPDKFLEHDFDLSGIGYKYCEKPLQEYVYKADASVSEIFASVLGDVPRGTAVSGDRFICEADTRARLYSEFGAASCDMETAAIASVCHFEKIPFVSLRRISDDAGDDALAVYRKMNVGEGETLSAVFLRCLTALISESGGK